MPEHVCPMHAESRQAGPGKCARCGMDLLPEGTRFALLRHMLGSPRHLAIMIALMVALMVAAMAVLH